MTRPWDRPGGFAGLLATHRWSVAAGLAGLAVWSGLQTLAPGPGPTVPVVTAGHDLAWGSVIGRDDLVVVRFPAGQVPGAAERDPARVVGRRPASAVRRGEPITDVRLLDTPDPTAATGPGAVAAPVRIADAAAARMLVPGMVVDVLATPAESFVPVQAPATVVAAGVRVLSVAPGEEPGGSDGALVVLATTDSGAARLATAAANGRLSVTWRL